ncbi:MAG TPA: rRNA adenine N-6-methyltransferase family protein, partial [Polyangia bacterium]|nr:rRNA adenine N-6-methyltransferase family protein [Polyangia bacterium]
ISLVPRAAPLAPVRDAALFEAVVKQAFATRRKMLRGALGAQFGEPAVTAAFAATGIAGTKRAEELSVAEFARLANALASSLGPWDGPKPPATGSGEQSSPAPTRSPRHEK